MSTDYITLAALKTTLSINTTDSDTDLSVSITAASRAVDKVCDRRFYLDADANQVRTYTPDGPLSLWIDDLNTLTSLKTDTSGDGTFDATWTEGTDFNLTPLNAQADSQDLWPYTGIQVRPYGSYVFNHFLPASVQVTGMFGWPAVPSAIVEATTYLAARMFKLKREAPLGILVFQDMAVRVARTDPNLRMVLGRYMRHVHAIS